MTKLHEILAVEGDLAGKAQAGLAATKDLFGKPDKFIGQTRRYSPLEDGGQPMPSEDTNVAFRVEDVISDLVDKFSAWLNVSIQKEVTNQKTEATITVDGIEILTLPATALLNLEQKLAILKSTLSGIPTNDVTERWEWDETSQVYIAPPRTTYRTEKRPRVLIRYEATPEHPAQTDVYTEDIRVGEWTTVIRSGMWSPNQKRELLDKLEKLIAAVKQARQRANDIEIEPVKVSEAINKYLGVALS